MRHGTTRNDVATGNWWETDGRGFRTVRHDRHGRPSIQLPSRETASEDLPLHMADIRLRGSRSSRTAAAPYSRFLRRVQLSLREDRGFVAKARSAFSPEDAEQGEALRRIVRLSRLNRVMFGALRALRRGGPSHPERRLLFMRPDIALKQRKKDARLSSSWQPSDFSQRPVRCARDVGA
jgi:hypothetical protein